MPWFGYDSWSLGSQLKVSFLLSSLLVCIALILITKYQFSDLQDQITQQYTSSLRTTFISQMIDLGIEESNYITQELQNFMSFNEQFTQIDTMILGLLNIPSPIIPGTPIQDTIYSPTDNDYTTGCFMTSRPKLSKAGKELEAKEAGMDQIYPLLESGNYLFIYSGFEIDEIIHYYPGGYTGDRTYSPLVREWYYSAKFNPSITQISEPYQDIGTFEWVITVSRAILDSVGVVYGVAACDITLVQLTSKTNNIKLLENGFAMLVTSGGMILTLPTAWNLDVSNVYKVFEESITGISEVLWNNVITSNDGAIFEVTNNLTTYILIKFSINPYANIDKVTHYLLMFADKDEIIAPLASFTNSYSSTNYTVFLTVISITIFAFLLISSVLYLLLRVLLSKIFFMRKTFVKIVNRALLTDITRDVSLDSIEEAKVGIERLFTALKTKLAELKNIEKNLSYFPWGNTRPQDKLIFKEWIEKLYPFNLHTNKLIEWRRGFADIENVSHNS